MNNTEVRQLRRLIREVLVEQGEQTESPLKSATGTSAQNENIEMKMGQSGKIRDDGHEVSMAESELYKIAEYAPKIYGMVENYEDLPGWVQKKITIASENISSVKHYLEHEHFRIKSGMK